MTVLVLLQQRFFHVVGAARAAAVAAAGAAAAAASETIYLTLRAVVPVLHAYRHVCNPLYGAAQLPSAGRPAEINEQAFAAVRTNAHAPEGINSGPGQWETLLHLLQRAHNLARMRVAPGLVLRLLSSQYQKLPAYRAEEAAARVAAANAGVDVSAAALDAEAKRQAVAVHKRSDRVQLSASDGVLKAFSLQARLAALRHALQVAGDSSTPEPVRLYRFHVAANASPDVQVVLRAYGKVVADAAAKGTPYLLAVQRLADELAKVSSIESMLEAVKSADHLIPALLSNLRDSQVRLADLARREVRDATLSGDMGAANRRATTLRIVKEARLLREVLVSLLPLSSDPVVKTYVPPAVEALSTSPLPPRIGTIVLAQGSPELQAVLTAVNKRASAEAEIEYLHGDVRTAVANTAELVAALEAQLDAATAPQPDLVAAAGRSGLFLRGDRDADGTASDGSSDVKPLLFHTLAPAVADGDAALFAHGLAYEVYDALLSMRGLLREWERLHEGLGLLRPYHSDTLSVQLDARGCGNITRYGGLLLRGQCRPVTWVRHVVGDAAVAAHGGLPADGSVAAAGEPAGGEPVPTFGLASGSSMDDGGAVDDVDALADAEEEEAAADHEADLRAEAELADGGAGDAAHDHGHAGDGRSVDGDDAHAYDDDDELYAVDPLQLLAALAPASGGAGATHAGAAELQ